MENFIVLSSGDPRQGLARFTSTNPDLCINGHLYANHSDLQRERLIANGLITPDNCYGRQALIDLALHVVTWRKCVEGQTITHVADDGLVLRHDFNRASRGILSRQIDFDLIVWGTDFTVPSQIRYAPGVIGRLIFSEPESEADLDYFREDITPPDAFPLLHCSAARGYTLSPRGAETLLRLCLPFGSRPVSYFNQADLVWANTGHFIEMARHYPKLQAFIVQPALAIQPPAATAPDNVEHFQKAFEHLCARHARAMRDGAPFDGRAF